MTNYDNAKGIRIYMQKCRKRWVGDTLPKKYIQKLRTLLKNTGINFLFMFNCHILYKFLNYRSEKKLVGPSGGSPSNWTYYEAVHKIIGSNAVNNTTVLESFTLVSKINTIGIIMHLLKSLNIYNM